MEFGKAPPIGASNIAKPVALSEADQKRQDMYAPLAEARRAELTAEGKAVPEETAPVEVVYPWTPTEDDKRNFTRALLGGRAYEKTYSLFDGLVKATFVDRSADQCETLYKALREGLEMNLFPAPDVTLWESRFHLAATLRKLEMDGRAPSQFDFPDNLANQVKLLMEQNTSPLYQALMTLSDTFERHLNLMIGNARTDSFWKTGGTVSR